ncbi:MAG: DUF1848 domain-containing protein [Acidobacteriota bacterium]|nr:DUF1848 domain-containing protein [Acidobacteriota bacterium]
MIISASYKTDVLTFYGDWLMNRLRAGFCKMVNPYNRRVTRISLLPEDVDGIVFWTKNVGPFLRHLPEVRQLGFPFILQHTINGYPRELEQAVVDAPKAIEYFRQVANTFGPRVNVWRYDTIINSSLTPREFHIETFARLAEALEGATDEVVISFAHLYSKTQRNMQGAAAEHGFSWTNPSNEWKRNLAGELAVLASAHRIQLTVCSQPQFVASGCAEARCVDANRLTDIGGKPIKACLKGNRKECGCFDSRDIGEYDTCPHGCVYCYAVQNQELAKARYKRHDPSGEALFPPSMEDAEPDERLIQFDLFEGGAFDFLNPGMSR